MSVRNQNLTLPEQLREIFTRLNWLETQSNKIRKNDIRLSDTVVTADSPNNRLCLRNIVTDAVVCIGADIDSSVPQAQWSFSGDLTSHEGDTSPAYLTESNCVARQILIARPYNSSFTGTVVMCVHFNNDSVVITSDLTSPSEFSVKEINVPLSENNDIYVELISVGTSVENISVFVRFGAPTVNVSESDCSF